MNNYLLKITAHYEQVWRSQGSKRYWTDGPVNELPPGFHILEFPPHDDREMWTYATCGMSQPGDTRPIEIHMFSEIQHIDNIELLTALAHYYHSGAVLRFGHTLNLGKSWIEGSLCTRGMLSLPYLDGEELELLDLETKTVQFLWLIPITESELDYKKQYGLDQTEKLFEERELDFANPFRDSLI
ncbi:suppressor of fused domain protein [Pelosinus sp. IPA-1]|uniref:suppressor of fused domain protein n=1 Tax=Pelosinus sp. IPA-1 TaxID=3029569 RepID=UPI0024361C22|nr:suppressor of fused domain protein [Pelosinus sp. IPA-1]GMA99503.1 hypothetical protein PIPA1_23030 [Pelosinus sp. IPA-1]